jgi:hypothetical protein
MICFIAIDVGGVILFGVWISAHLWVLVAVVSVQFIVSYVIAQSMLISPIIRLKKEIAQFITGGKRGSALELTSRNPEMRFIVDFFNKTLNFLKNFKDEFQS